MSAVMYIGDAIEVMNKLPAQSVDLLLTSPPFWALRSYLPGDHEDKHREGGSQATPGEFVDWLIDFSEAAARVLAPHGSMCVELGDTYSGGGQGPDDRYPGKEEQHDYDPGKRGQHTKDGLPLAKSLSLIPELFRLSLVYGFNPLTGRQTERWRLRNVVRWVRPNPPVGALGDKFRPATSELMVFCKSAKRYFDLDAVRTEFLHPEQNGRNLARGGPTFGEKGPNLDRGDLGAGNFGSNTAGAPPLDWWEIPPGGYEGSHYAVFPLELCVRPVKAMCPEKVCKVCGEPSRRITEHMGYVSNDGTMHDRTRYMDGGKPDGSLTMARVTTGNSTKPLGVDASRTAVVETRGWTDCGHDSWRPGLILDCFGGSGTVAAVATGHGRDCILIDLDERNFDLALGRVGPFMLTLGNIDEGFEWDDEVPEDVEDRRLEQRIRDRRDVGLD